MKNIRIATRRSDLALWQANWVKSRLEALGHKAELVLIETQGDLNLQAFKLLPGQGFFTKAVQDAVINKTADLAVHSFKDLPSATMSGLELAAMSERADPRDVLLIRLEVFTPASSPLPLKTGITVGTSAVRRQAQLKHLRADLELKELRGNIPTRVQKLRDGLYDTIVLAAAGIKRLKLDLAGLKLYPLSPDVLVPAPAQGVVAIECRREDFELASILTELHSPESHRAVAAERGLMAMLKGGCQLALGAHATLDKGAITLSAWYEGKQISVQDVSAEGAAFLAYEALGRPVPQSEVEV